MFECAVILCFQDQSALLQWVDASVHMLEGTNKAHEPLMRVFQKSQISAGSSWCQDNTPEEITMCSCPASLAFACTCPVVSATLIGFAPTVPGHQCSPADSAKPSDGKSMNKLTHVHALAITIILPSTCSALVVGVSTASRVRQGLGNWQGLPSIRLHFLGAPGTCP